MVFDTPHVTRTTTSQTGLDKRYDDLVAALADMGYDKRQVVTALSDLLREHDTLLVGKNLHEAEEFLFRNAIIRLG